jgi:NADH/F420H2 dehydrogenase subunit C
MSDTKPKLPPTHSTHSAEPRVLEENQLDHDLLRRKLAGLILDVSTVSKQTVMRATRENIVAVLQTLKDDRELNFNMITDITAVDNMRRIDFDPSRRFTMIYIVYSIPNRKRVRIEVDVPEENPRVPTTAKVYLGCAWIEREVYDMFGIEFTGHPDLRRVLLPEYYEHFPLRKDYPLTGRGERDNFIRAEEVS